MRVRIWTGIKDEEAHNLAIFVNFSYSRQECYRDETTHSSCKVEIVSWYSVVEINLFLILYPVSYSISISLTKLLKMWNIYKSINKNKRLKYN